MLPAMTMVPVVKSPGLQATKNEGRAAACRRHPQYAIDPDPWLSVTT
jgi:hypothetical protein